MTAKDDKKKLINDINPLAYYGHGNDLEINKDMLANYRHQRDHLGCDATEIWDLDSSIAQFLVPRLIILKENSASHPSDTTFEEWHSILDQMIEGFEIIAHESVTSLDPKVDKAIELLAKYFRNLWD